jgi:hypothetical protein
MKKLQLLVASKPFQWAITAAVVLLILKTGSKLLPTYDALPNFQSPWFVLAVVLAIVYRIVNAYGWTVVLRAMGQNVDGNLATRIWLMAESRRWLPGGVWGYASRASRAKEVGLASGIATASMMVELLVTILAAILSAIPALLLHQDQFRAVVGSVSDQQSTFSLIAVACGLGLVAFLGRNRILSKVASLKNKLAAFRGIELQKFGLLAAVGFFLLVGCLNGIVTCMLCWSFPMDAVPPLEAVIAATSISWLVGFFAIFAPGGLVVRETAFALCLAFWMPYTAAIGVAVFARLVQILAELGCMAWCGYESRTNNARLSETAES